MATAVSSAIGKLHAICVSNLMRHGDASRLRTRTRSSGSGDLAEVKLDGYTKSNCSAVTLGHGDQDMNSTVGRIGWQARFDGGNVKPYVQVTYEHEFEVSKQASAWLQTMPEAGMRKVPRWSSTGTTSRRFWVRV